MANLGQLVSRKNAADNQWRADRQAERDNVTAMQDAGIAELTSNPEKHAQYLDLQGDNPDYSPGNIALVQIQLPGATIFGTAERWKAQGRFVLDSEQRKGAKIFARVEDKKGFVVADAYDITQTQGRDITQFKIAKDGKEMETALATLLNYAIGPVITNKELPTAAYYDMERMELSINPDAKINGEVFAAIAAEVAHTRFHAKGFNAYYKRSESELDAQSISYILCRRLGIAQEKPDLTGLQKLYKGWSAQESRRALDEIQKMTKKMGRSITQSIIPQRRSRPIPRESRNPQR